MAGERTVNRRNPFEAPPPRNPLASQYKTYDASVNQNAQDYDEIMGNYRNLFQQNNNQIQNTGKYTPITASYTSTPEYTGAIGKLNKLADSGGYTEEDIADMRSRGVSPIRAAYANADREIKRRSAISGGTSANYGALKARMAREQADKASQAVQDVNAGIAAGRAGNRLTATSNLTSATGNEQNNRNQFGLENARIQNDASKFNLGRADDNSGRGLAINEGMRSLYGTTPALSATFGDQAMRAATLQNQINQQNTNNSFNAVSRFTDAMQRRRGGR